MPGMAISARSTSGFRAMHAPSAASPSPTLPTTSTPSHSESKAERRVRASGSSSAIRTRMSSGFGFGQAHDRAITPFRYRRLQAGARAEVIGDAAAHVVLRVPVAPHRRIVGNGIVDFDFDRAVDEPAADAHHAAAAQRLDAVVHRIFHQWLQQQWWYLQ